MNKHSCEFCYKCHVQREPPVAYCDEWRRPLPEENNFHGLTIENGCDRHGFCKYSAIDGEEYGKEKTLFDTEDKDVKQPGED